MKTFETIGISSVIFYINKGGNILEKTMKEHGYSALANLKNKERIHAISKNDQDKTLDFNKQYNSYGGNHSYLVRVPYDKINESHFETEKNVFYLNEEDFASHVRRIIVENIKKTEQEIIDVAAQKAQYIRKLRENYWDVLQ